MIIEKLRGIGVVPVVKIDDASKASKLAKSLIDGGIACAEVTFRTDAAKEAIINIRKAFPEMIVGAGTVLTLKQLDDACEAGVSFVVTPGFNEVIINECIKRNMPIIPGCSTPTDFEKAISLGINTVKFFPAEQSGGIDYIKAVSAPYSQLTFMPTGGISPDNINDYLSFNKVACCGGSWMVNAALIENDRFDEIERLSKQTIDKIIGLELAHIGINADNEEEAKLGAEQLCKLFGFSSNPGNTSIFLDKSLEIMKTPYLGKNGHIAFAVNNLERAIYHLENKGFKFNRETEKFDAKGNFVAIYLKDEILGFAFHLLQKK